MPPKLANSKKEEKDSSKKGQKSSKKNAAHEICVEGNLEVARQHLIKYDLPPVADH
jgi:hypothetical protein